MNRDALRRQISEWLASQRLLSGLTQAELAQAIGRQQSYISKIENGEQQLEMLEFIEICAKLSVDPTEIVSTITKALAK
jgi:transcriptional regulator with XRE-family HTH domain